MPNDTNKMIWEANIFKSILHEILAQSVICLFQVNFYSHPPLGSFLPSHRVKHLLGNDYVVIGMSLGYEVTLARTN